MLPNQGTHRAKLASQIVLYETEEGAFCAAVQGTLDGDFIWTGKKTAVLVKKDGTTNNRVIADMTDIFGDPFDESNEIYRFAETEEKPITEIEGAAEIRFEFVIEHKEKIPEDGGAAYMVAEIAWLNKLGGGIKMPEPASRADILKKYKGKFKALTGSAAAKPAAKETPVPGKDKIPPKKPATPGKRTADNPLATTATLEEAWNALLEGEMSKDAKGKSLSEDATQKVWFEIMDEMFGAGTSDSQDLNPKQWGQLKDKFDGK